VPKARSKSLVYVTGPSKEGVPAGIARDRKEKKNRGRGKEADGRDQKYERMGEKGATYQEKLSPNKD